MADRFQLSRDQDIIQDFENGGDRLELPTLNGVTRSFNDLEIVPMGQSTQIRWESPGVSFGGITLGGGGLNVTTLEGVQASQITVDDFVPRV